MTLDSRISILRNIVGILRSIMDILVIDTLRKVSHSICTLSTLAPILSEKLITWTSIMSVYTEFWITRALGHVNHGDRTLYVLWWRRIMHAIISQCTTNKLDLYISLSLSLSHAHMSLMTKDKRKPAPTPHCCIVATARRQATRPRRTMAHLLGPVSRISVSLMFLWLLIIP